MKAHRLLYHSTLGLRVIKKKKTRALTSRPVSLVGVKWSCLRIMIDSGLAGASRDHKMLKGNLPRVVYHQEYFYTQNMVWALRSGFRDQVSGFRVQGSRFGVECLGFRVQGLGVGNSHGVLVNEESLLWQVDLQRRVRGFLASLIASISALSRSSNLQIR